MTAREVWRLRDGDIVRLPYHHPAVVRVEDSTYAGTEYDRLHWSAGNEYGSVVLPRCLEVEIVR